MVGLRFGRQLRLPRMQPPDCTERRDGRCLLVWQDIPHWMVIDEELHGLLLALDGTRSLRQALRDHSTSWQGRRTAQQVVKALSERGLVTNGKPTESRETPKARLENVAINLTSRCNLRCPCCYNLSRLETSNEGELQFGEILAFLESVHPMLSEQPTLAVLGGEPLLRPDVLLEVARFAYAKGITVQASSNGTSIPSAFARQAAEIGLEMQVSLDGPTSALNSQLRPAGSFEKAVEGVRTLVDHGVHTTISMVCHRGNLESLEAYYDLGLELAVDQVRFIPLKRIGGASDGRREVVSITEMVEAARTLFDRRPEFIRVAGRDAFSILAGSCSCGVRRVSCGTGRQTVLLDADGSLYPCVNTNRSEFCFGNIRDDGFDFDRLWTDSPVLQEVRSKTHMDGTESACRECVVRYWCLAGCRGENYAVAGRLNGRAVNCRDQKSAVFDMMWILAEKPELRQRVTPPC